MYLVSREILFDVMKNKHPIHLSESDETSSFQAFCKKANTEYAKATSSKLKKNKQMDAFANSMLDFMKQNKNDVRFVGQGSSRIVFAMADGTALKMAKSEAGIDQNQQEAKLCMNPLMKHEIFPDFYGADKAHWLALNCELCAKATREDFKQLFACQPQVICNVIEFIIRTDMQDFQYESLVEYYRNLDNSLYALFVKKLINDKNPAMDAIRSLINFYREHGLNELMMGDLEVIDNWGISIRDNNKVLVVIDAGFNHDVYQKHYRRNK